MWGPLDSPEEGVAVTEKATRHFFGENRRQAAETL